MTCVSALWLQVSLQSSLIFLAYVFMVDIILRTRNETCSLVCHCTTHTLHSLKCPAEFSDCSAGRRPPPPLLSHPPESRSSSVSEQKVFSSVMRYLLKNMLANRHTAHPFVASLLTIMCLPLLINAAWSVQLAHAWVNQTLTGLIYIYLSCTYSRGIIHHHLCSPSPESALPSVVQPLA